MKKALIKIFKLLNKNSTQPITKSERYIIMTALKTMHKKDSELLLHPSKDRFYIYSESDGMFLVINRYPQNVTVVNHKFSYDVKFSNRAMDFLTGKFIETTEGRRDVFEQTFLKNTENSLSNIYRSVQ